MHIELKEAMRAVDMTHREKLLAPRGIQLAECTLTQRAYAH